MKQNRIHQRALALLLSFALLFSIFAIDTVGASAASSDGRTTLWLDSGHDITISDSGRYVITQRDSGHPVTNTVSVTSGAPDIVLENVNIDVSGSTSRCAFSIAPGAAVNLILKGTNTLKGGKNCAGIQVPGSLDHPDDLTQNASLTISAQENGTLDVTGGNGGGSFIGGAGIGGGDNLYGASGNITINSGRIKATAGSDYCAGIGAGLYEGGSHGSGGRITINGGSVEATGGAGGAGIGGGEMGTSGKITINGGSVRATGGDDSAGIGGGDLGNGDIISINGGIVEAHGVNGGAGIGGGDSGDGGTITISGNAEVHAIAEPIPQPHRFYGHDIGSGYYDTNGGTLAVYGTDLRHSPTVEVQSNGINAAKPNGTAYQFVNCKIYGAGAKDAGSHNVSGCYDANGKIRLSAALSAVPKNPGSTVFGSPVTLTAANIARVGFDGTPTLSGKLLFLCDGHPFGDAVSLTASVDWTPNDAKEHHLTVQYQAAEGESYAINSEDVAPYPFTYSAGKVTPTVTAPAVSIPYGSKLTDVLLSGGSAKNIVSSAGIPGSFSWAQQDTVIKTSGIYYAVFSPDDGTDYNTVSAIPVHVNVTKATPMVTTAPTASQITSGDKLSASTFTGGTVTDASGAAILGTFAWAQPDTVVMASGSFDAVFNPNDTTNYNTASVSVPVTVTVEPTSSNSINSSGTSTPPLPSSVTDTVSNTQADLTGATMPAGVTSVTLSVTPETADGTPATPGTAGGASDPQGAAAFKLAVSDTSLNIIGTPILYNLKLLDQNGSPITGFNGKVAVKIPVPAELHGTPHVFRYEESTGSFTDMNAFVENGFLVFETEHFSYYTVAGVGDSITLDTKAYQMPVNGKYQIGVKLTGSKAAAVKVYSTNDKIAAVAKLKDGKYQVTGKGTGTAYIMFDVYDNKNHLLTHASVRIDVKTSIRPRGDSTRQVGVF